MKYKTYRNGVETCLEKCEEEKTRMSLTDNIQKQ